MPVPSLIARQPLFDLMKTVIGHCPYPLVLLDRQNKNILTNRGAAGHFNPDTRMEGFFPSGLNHYSGPDSKTYSVVYLPFGDGQERYTLAVFIPAPKDIAPALQINDLQSIIEASHDGIMVADRDGKILLANQSYERLTGNKLEDVIGHKIFDLVQEGFHTDPLVDLVVKRKEPVTNTQYLPAQRNCLMITGNPVLGQDGEVRWVVLSFRDITQLNQLQYELEHARELTERYSAELAELRKQVVKQTNIVARSPSMKKVIELALHVAKVDSTVLIQGESGAGKELIAKIIHNNSSRGFGAFIKINCTAIPETLIESEPFGYEAGAFTGANRQGKAGLFELAHNGTLLLDEIGDMPLNFQTKFLRALQEQEITRVGGTKPRKINVRILAATNQDLKKLVKEKGFREDLYFRLNVVPIQVPPLRERQADIIPLIFFYQEYFSRKYSLKKELTPDAINLLAQYHWPGNVRELVNLVERLLVTSVSPVITAANLPEELLFTVDCREAVSVKGILPLKQAVEELERQLLERALASYGSTYKAAEVLKIDQSTIVKKLKRLRREEKADH